MGHESGCSRGDESGPGLRPRGRGWRVSDPGASLLDRGAPLPGDDTYYGGGEGDPYASQYAGYENDYHDDRNPYANDPFGDGNGGRGPYNDRGGSQMMSINNHTSPGMKRSPASKKPPVPKRSAMKQHSAYGGGGGGGYDDYDGYGYDDRYGGGGGGPRPPRMDPIEGPVTGSITNPSDRTTTAACWARTVSTSCWARWGWTPTRRSTGRLARGRRRLRSLTGKLASRTRSRLRRRGPRRRSSRWCTGNGCSNQNLTSTGARTSRWIPTHPRASATSCSSTARRCQSRNRRRRGGEGAAVGVRARQGTGYSSRANDFVDYMNHPAVPDESQLAELERLEIEYRIHQEKLAALNIF